MPIATYINRPVGNLLWDPMRLFNDVLWQPPGAEVVLPPPVQVQHSENGVTIVADMPGVDSRDLDLTFERGTLTITGKRGERVQRFAVALGDTIDPDRIEAALDKGVLTIVAEKRPETKPRKIAIASGMSVKSLGDGESK
jgi:HSP20 family protein